MTDPIDAPGDGQGFAIFETPIGACGIAWGPRGITGLQLPETTAQGTRARLRRRWPGATETPPPAGVQRAIDRVLALLAGQAVDLGDIALDLDATKTAEATQIDALKACSSDSRFRKDATTGLAKKLFWNSTGATLSDDFKEIGNELSNLRIVG